MGTCVSSWGEPLIISKPEEWKSAFLELSEAALARGTPGNPSATITLFTAIILPSLPWSEKPKEKNSVPRIKHNSVLSSIEYLASYDHHPPSRGGGRFLPSTLSFNLTTLASKFKCWWLGESWGRGKQRAARVRQALKKYPHSHTRQLERSVCFLTWAEMTFLTAQDRISSLKALCFFENRDSRPLLASSFRAMWQKGQHPQVRLEPEGKGCEKEWTRFIPGSWKLGEVKVPWRRTSTLLPF